MEILAHPVAELEEEVLNQLALMVGLSHGNQVWVADFLPGIQVLMAGLLPWNQAKVADLTPGNQVLVVDLIPWNQG